MFTAEETTKERVAAYVAALEQEKKGYAARLAALADGHTDRLSADQLNARAKGVDDELARMKKLKPKDSEAEKE